MSLTKVFNQAITWFDEAPAGRPDSVQIDDHWGFPMFCGYAQVTETDVADS